MQKLRMERELHWKYLVRAYWNGMDEDNCEIVVRDLDTGWNVFDEEYDFTELFHRFCEVVEMFEEKYCKERNAI